MDTERSAVVWQEYYGDEAARLEALQHMDYEDFKQCLVAIRNTHPNKSREGDIDYDGAAEESGFVRWQNATCGGALFPRAEDKDGLLLYALEEAKKQDDIQVAALILGTATVAAHPFEDRNGRTSRTVYSLLSRGADATPDSIRRPGAREMVSFLDPADDEHGIVDRLIFKEAQFPKVAEQAWHDEELTDSVAEHYRSSQYAGLNWHQSNQLDMVLGVRDGLGGRYANNENALLFACSKLAAEGREDALVTAVGSHGWKQVLITESLVAMDAATKCLLVEYAQQYVTLRAKAVIDMVGKHGDLTLRLPHAVMSCRDYVVERTNNFLASRIGGLAHRKSVLAAA